MSDYIDGYLIRFFQKAKYLNEFRKGEIRMMSAYYYASLERGCKQLYNNRYDFTEGVSYIYNNTSREEVSLKEPNFEIKLGDGVESICINSTEPNLQIKLSCYYYLSKSKIIDGNFFTELSAHKGDLGNYYCLFTNPKDFLLRCDSKLKSYIAVNKVKQYSSGFPTYDNIDNAQGFLGPFVKPDGLSWQNEFRLVVSTNNEPDPFYLSVGDLTGISVCGKREDILKGRVVDNDTIIIPNATNSLLPEENE